MLITENQLDEWVRAHSRDAQGVIVELIWRLVAASSPRPRERRFPLGDSIGQHGPDGLLDVDLAYAPFVPEGRSYWEIGTGLNAGTKATSDYKDLTAVTPPAVRMVSSFVFVTPLSGRRDWDGSWKDEAQLKWLERRRADGEWMGVHVIDGTKLMDWVHSFLSVELWLAQRISNLPGHQIETAEQRWGITRSIGEPPSLTPQVFLSNREEACAKLKEIFDETTVQLKLETHFPDQVVDFVCAYLAALGDETRTDAMGRCLVVSGAEAWNTIVSYRQKHFLVADATLDLSGDAGTKLIQKARRAGHAVIFGGPRGGIPDPASVSLSVPRGHQIRDALEQAGYNEERARALVQKSDGHLGSLLRCLQNLSLMPEWAESSAAADLAIAAILGSWTEKSDADRAVVEAISGNAYGEWVSRTRAIALRPGTPLSQRDGNWRFIARYEGWYALGAQVFDEHLDRLKTTAICALREKDPQFDLLPDERYAARIDGKVLTHSPLIRNGLAECLALLGSHPKALTSCTQGKAVATAVLAVRAILNDADWQQWASLNALLPLLAEAAPNEFMDAVEQAINKSPSPFDSVFAQEGDGLMGSTYMSGLLWALETLAWDPDLLTRAAMCLGELADRDPGGRWANRPSNSLRAIFLPWLPQTCASIGKRRIAVSTLLSELPVVGWKLLLNLLPDSHSTSSGTRKPAWRDTIPDDWSKGTTQGDYWDQVEIYSVMAITAAENDRQKLVDLIDRLEKLQPSTRDQLLMHLGSKVVLEMPEIDRLAIWTELVDLVTKHKKYSNAGWALASAQVETLSALADRLAPDAPAFRHQRLFSERDFDLYDEKGNYEEQREKLEKRRQIALSEVAANGGVQAVVDFSATVQSPWRVGIAYGVVAQSDADKVVLPALLESENSSVVQFAGGFVWSRFRSIGWSWVDGFDVSKWTPPQIGAFLSYLPFAPLTWERTTRLLGDRDLAYWSKTSANPYESDDGLELAVDRLINHGRPYAAIRCLYKLLYDKKPLDSRRIVQALLAALKSSESPHSMDSHEVVELIKALQNDANTNPEDLFQVEWAYLPLLERHSGAAPVLLGRRLANEPQFFCEVIRLVFRSKKDERVSDELSGDAKIIATNAYRLLSEWQTPPGLKVDGAFDGKFLADWLESVKVECSESGHLEIALTMLGHALIHVPADPDGLWIDSAVAAILNAKDAGDMRDGFRTELFNSRGVHMVDPSGKPERELAEKYRLQAEAVDGAGYHRLATTLRELVDGYLRDAERVASRAGFDD